MMAAVGLADLVRLFAARPASEHRASAELIGFRQQELPPAQSGARGWSRSKPELGVGSTGSVCHGVLPNHGVRR